jgi:chaperonin GroEL
MSPPFSPKPSRKTDFQKPTVVFQPQVARGLQSGFDQLIQLIRPTLGPLPHTVAVEKVAQRGSIPELLDSGATIARRIIQIPDRDADVGLMYLRHVLWKLQESEGDGTATAAVIFQTVFNEGLRYVVAGGNAMSLRQHFEKGLLLLLDQLDQQTMQIYGKQRLAGLARAICYDDELAKMLGEIFDIIGAYGRLEVRKSSSRELDREYVEGMYWAGGLRSREMGNAQYGLRLNLENAHILISDLEIETPDQLVPLLQMALQNNVKELLLVSATLSEKAIAILLNKANREKVFVAAVKTPGPNSDEQHSAMQDLAILTGGRVISKATGDTLQQVRYEDLGRARRIWADTEFFGIVGGRGDARVLRQHIASLRQAFRGIVPSISGEAAQAANDRRRLLERLGKLVGGSATLYIGDMSPSSVEAREELAKHTAEAMRGAMREGVVPGGGVALLNCRAALEHCRNQAQDDDERAAYVILLKAVEAPFRTIVENSGLWAGKVLAEVDQAGPGYGYDVLARRVAHMAETGIFDAAPVVKGALRSGIAGAALALTTEAVIHRKNPPEVLHT